MTVRVVFFARIREDLGCADLDVELPPGGGVAVLVEVLASRRGERWRETLTADNVRVAVNQTLITGDRTLRDGDEVAFFPPVTGG